MSLPLYHGKHKPSCATCSHKGMLLCCDYCSLAYHPNCVFPPIKSQPTDYWACPQCQYLLDSHEIQITPPPVSPVSPTSPVSSISVSSPSRSPFHSKSRCSLSDGGKSRSQVFTSKYRGVYSRAGKWNAQIQFNGKKVYLGSYSSEEEAARAYDIAAKRYHGSKAILNFHVTNGAICRNPFQVNSKPTCRTDANISTSNNVREYNRTPSTPIRRVHSVNAELHPCSPVIFINSEERRKLLHQNREECRLLC